MIYIENASKGTEGFNTHLLAYTFAVSFANFLDRDFFFDYEIPCSTPPDFAFRDEFREKFKVLLESPRSLVTDLIEQPAATRRRFEIDREAKNKLVFEELYNYFATTEELKKTFDGTLVWESFAVGRAGLTREQLQSCDLIEWINPKLSHPSVFYFLKKAEKNALLRSIEIKFLAELENLARKITGELGAYNSFHLRLGDFLKTHNNEFWVNIERFQKYVRATFNPELPVVAATDALYEKEVLAQIFKGYRLTYVDELIFDEYRSAYEELPFTDFNALTVLNELICASAATFIGTYRSTMTAVIHRIRQERFEKRDFNFFPDERVAKLLSADFVIKPDRSGFFDWNKYSIFSQYQMQLAWMREWDYEFCALNF